jgi:hypothetical protein
MRTLAGLFAGVSLIIAATLAVVVSAAANAFIQLLPLLAVAASVFAGVQLLALRQGPQWVTSDEPRALPAGVVDDEKRDG